MGSGGETDGSDGDNDLSEGVIEDSLGVSGRGGAMGTAERLNGLRLR